MNERKELYKDYMEMLRQYSESHIDGEGEFFREQMGKCLGLLKFTWEQGGQI